MKHVPLLLALATFAACDRPAPPPAPAASAPARALRPVASEAVAALERELGPTPAVQPADAELTAHVEGLLESLSTSDEGARK